MNKPWDMQPPQPKLLTSRDKYENSFWMEQLPAHVWVQDEENSVIFSNRLSLNQLAMANGRYCRRKKISCCSAFMGEKMTCSCCPYQRVTSTLQAESCICRRDEDVYHVYHFPFAANDTFSGGHSPYVLKIEINAGSLLFHRQRAMESEAVPTVSSRKKTGSGLLVKICAACKKVKDDSGSWLPLEKYFKTSQGVQFSHGICGECACRLYPKIWPSSS